LKHPLPAGRDLAKVCEALDRVDAPFRSRADRARCRGAPRCHAVAGLGALAGSVSREREQRHRAQLMIDDTIIELTEQVGIGIGAACKAVGRPRATHHRRTSRRHGPPVPPASRNRESSTLAEQLRSDQNGWAILPSSWRRRSPSFARAQVEAAWLGLRRTPAAACRPGFELLDPVRLRGCPGASTGMGVRYFADERVRLSSLSRQALLARRARTELARSSDFSAQRSVRSTGAVQAFVRGATVTSG
jgi:hypothetical protein